MRDKWISEIFCGKDPMDFCPAAELDDIDNETVIDWIDEILINPSILNGMSATQIAYGLTYIYHNAHSEYPFLYINKLNDENRTIKAIHNLEFLYTNYFAKYCSDTVTDIGKYNGDQFEHLCYMFWDIFALWPEAGTPKLHQAAIEVMQKAIYSDNESCVVSGLHGLSDWKYYLPQIDAILDEFCKHEKKLNPEILQYAFLAKYWYV